MNKIKRFFEHTGRDKTFKYRISEEEGVILSTHDSEKFPIENIRLEWGYTLIFQPAFSQIIKKIYSRAIRENDDDISESEKEKLERYKFLCDAIKTSEEKDCIEVSCTEEEIEFIEECADLDWKESLDRHNILKGKEFPEHLKHLKDTLTSPDANHIRYLNSRYNAFKKIISTRHV